MATKKQGFEAFLGKMVMVRTVTYFHVGRLEKVLPGELVLTECAWVADTGRFSEALKSGNVNEVEPFPDGEVLVSRGAVVDCCLWAHAPLRSMK